MNSSLSLILVTVLFGVSGQVALKLGMSQVGHIGAEALGQPLQLALRVLGTPLVLGGLGLYVLGAAGWLTVLSRLPLSFAYPILALGYVITPILAWIFLGEQVPSLRWLGIATISLGVVLISRS